MPSAAPISGMGVVRVETVSLGGTVKERVMATRRGVSWSGVHGVAEEGVDMLKGCVRVVLVNDGVLVCTRHWQAAKGLPVAMLLPGC
jgi:hypothetical protein